MARRSYPNYWERRDHRILQALDQTVRFVDSGWTEDEWEMIAKATAKRDIGMGRRSVAEYKRRARQARVEKARKLRTRLARESYERLAAGSAPAPDSLQIPRGEIVE